MEETKQPNVKVLKGKLILETNNGITEVRPFTKTHLVKFIGYYKVGDESVVSDDPYIYIYRGKITKNTIKIPGSIYKKANGDYLWIAHDPQNADKYHLSKCTEISKETILEKLNDPNLKLHQVTPALLETSDGEIFAPPIRETDDIIESIGVEKSKELVHQADLVLLVIDGSQELSDEDKQLLELTKDATRIIVINKIDQGIKVDLQGVKISAKDNQIGDLVAEIKTMFELGKIIDNNNYILTNARQTMLLQRASQSLNQAVDAMKLSVPTDLIVTDLYECWNNLKEILGEKAKEDLLDELFKRFCIGK